AELSGAFALIQQLKSMSTMLLVTAAADHARAAVSVTDLLREAERLGVGHRADVSAVRPLSRLTPGQSDLLSVAATFGATFDAHDLARELNRVVADLETDLEHLARSKHINLVDTVDRDGDLVDV